MPKIYWRLKVRIDLFSVKIKKNVENPWRKSFNNWYFPVKTSKRLKKFEFSVKVSDRECFGRVTYILRLRNRLWWNLEKLRKKSKKESSGKETFSWEVKFFVKTQQTEEKCEPDLKEHFRKSDFAWKRFPGRIQKIWTCQKV